MIKAINFFIPFLIEMLFGKKDERVILSPTQKLKRRIAYIVIVISFAVNYFVINKIYTLTLTVIALKREKSTYEIKQKENESALAKADQLEKSLEYCVRYSHNSPVIDKPKRQIHTPGKN